MHGYVATNRLLQKMNIIDSDICDFCDQQEQTLCHLFYECRLVKEFWASVQSWLTTECGINCDFCPKTVIFGVLEKDNFLNTVMLCEITHYEWQSAGKTNLYGQICSRPIFGK